MRVVDIRSRMKSVQGRPEDVIERAIAKLAERGHEPVLWRSPVSDVLPNNVQAAVALLDAIVDDLEAYIARDPDGDMAMVYRDQLRPLREAIALLT